MTDLTTHLQAIVDSAQLQYAEIDAGGADGRHLKFSHRAVSTDAPPETQLFLVASITKSIVATMALQLVAEGRFGLSERITDWLPELPAARFRRITIRHLLTHTSGLPDMLPGNAQLRADHSDLGRFLQGVAEHGTDFTPGTDCRYSSKGFLLLGEIISRAVGTPLPEVLRSQLFEPTGMTSLLGIPSGRDDLLQAAIPSALPPWQTDGADWDWNSVYWRSLGAPWGGLLASAADLGRFCRMVLRGGTSEDGQRVLAPAAIDALLQNQSQGLFEVPDSVTRKRPWGYGWRFAWPEHSASFGDLVPATAMGHWGATGTIFWVDRREQIYAVILTNMPFEQSRIALQRMSNVVCASLRSLTCR